MNWFRRMFSRQVPQSRLIAELEQVGEWVELRGRVEGLRLIHHPIDGSQAVMIQYTARIRALAEGQLGLNDPASASSHHQGASFLLHDSTGVVMIEVEAGEDVKAVHDQLLARFDAGIEINVETVAPGDQLRVRGRVRELVTGTSPHRSVVWSAVVEGVQIEQDRAEPL